jgi:hypothetical protein
LGCVKAFNLKKCENFTILKQFYWTNYGIWIVVKH